jgi:hypothetical protein
MPGSEAKGRAYAPQMLVPGERRFIKHDRQRRARGLRQGRGHRGAGSRPNRHLTYDQTPAYKGVWTLSLGRSNLLLPPLAQTARGAL